MLICVLALRSIADFLKRSLLFVEPRGREFLESWLALAADMCVLELSSPPGAGRFCGGRSTVVGRVDALGRCVPPLNVPESRVEALKL